MIISKPKTKETKRKTKFIVLSSTTYVISNHRRLNPKLHTAKSMPIASPMEQEPTHFFKVLKFVTSATTTQYET